MKEGINKMEVYVPNGVILHLIQVIDGYGCNIDTWFFPPGIYRGETNGEKPFCNGYCESDNKSISKTLAVHHRICYDELIKIYKSNNN